jgi:oxygen-independent coproporphyrinogen-3 oxidase
MVSTFDTSESAVALHAGDVPDADLIRRYDVSGPRYTSYPTAPQFTTRFRESDYREVVAQANAKAATQPLSMYVHIPFCSSPCFYCACTKIITRQMSVANRYLQYLEQEIERQGALFPRTRRVEQLHFGGGTPTYFSGEQLRDLIACIDRHFQLDYSDAREFSIEIDPRTVDEPALRDLSALGFNRASFGIQDFDPAVQKAVNREQPADRTLALLDAARPAGFRSISLDLIYGLPLQTVKSFERTLDLVIAARPDRIAAYSYAHLPQRFRPQRRIRMEDLPTAATKLQLLELTTSRLLEAGYVHIGMDHFAHPEDELAHALGEGRLQRNFQGYSTRAGLDLVALGISAIGKIGDNFSQNARTISAYEHAIDGGGLAIERGLRLSTEDRLRRDVIDAIMCRGRVNLAVIEERYGIDFREHFAPELQRLQPMQHDGLIEDTGGELRVTPTGRYLLRALAMPFDAYLPGAATTPAATTTEPQVTHSRII